MVLALSSCLYALGENRTRGRVKQGGFVVSDEDLFVGRDFNLKECVQRKQVEREDAIHSLEH